MLADVGHIVVVDDDPSLRQMVIRYLEDHDIPTKPASNRTELNRHLTGTIPSLIILDLRLGQDDGLDMLREIRSHSDVPVIITTGHRPDEIDRINIYWAGLLGSVTACAARPISEEARQGGGCFCSATGSVRAAARGTDPLGIGTAS